MSDRETNPDEVMAEEHTPAGDGDDLLGLNNAAATVEMDQLRGELEDARGRILRAQAELENFRRRVQRERDEERRYANLGLLRDLLPVVDNVGRAIEAAERTPDTASLLEGLKLVAQLLVAVLTQHHCTRIAPLGEPFDPHLHQAISQQPTSEHPANTVTTVVQNGYLLHDRVIRPAQVVVAIPALADA
jgi:molecular chaperone GrpE